jgi:uncharacterized protein YhhL (DUF1145 family)
MMDFEALQKFAVANFALYFSVTVDTLTSPGLHFAPVAVQTSGQETGLPASRVGSQLNPQLVGFAVLSMFLGLTLNSVINKRLEGEHLFVIEVVGLLFWGLYAALVHLLCKLARGHGSFLDTVSVTIQIFATLYIVCSLLATTLAMIILLKPVKSFVAGLGSIGELVAENPVVLFFLFNTVLLMIYLPIGLKPVHGFNVLQQIAVGVPTGLIVLVHGIAMLALTGAIWSVDPSAGTSGVGGPVALVMSDRVSIVAPIGRCAGDRHGAALGFAPGTYRERAA